MCLLWDNLYHDKHSQVVCTSGSTGKPISFYVDFKTYATGASYAYFNSDSNTSNYGFQFMYALNTTIIAVRGISMTGINISDYGYDTTTAIYGKTNLMLYANNVNKLILHKSMRNVGSSYVKILYNTGYVWNNSETLTSMKFNGHFSPNTHIEIWAKR